MLKAEFPGTKFLLGPGLHRVAPGVEEVRPFGESPLIDPFGPWIQPVKPAQVWSYYVVQCARAAVRVAIMLHSSCVSFAIQCGHPHAPSSPSSFVGIIP